VSGPPGFRASGVEPVGYTDLGGKPVFKLAVQRVGERWYLWATHFWEPRLSCLDVTDPASPQVVAAVEGPDDSATWQVQVADGLLVQGLEHRPVAWGGDPDSQAQEGVRLFDVADPVHPRLLSTWSTGAHGTHRNHWTGGRYVHLAASQPGYEGNVYVVLDVQDRAHPRAVGRWALPEQEEGRGTGRRVSFHGPAYVVDDRAYLPYGAAGLVVLDISDVTSPQLVSRLDIGAAFSSTIAMHTAVPRPGRDLVLVNTEAIAERSQEPYNFAGVVDVSDERAPRLLSLLPPPVPEPDMPWPNFNTRGGRFGPHNQHHPQDADTLFDSDTLVFMTWFNAGLRVYDTTDPYVPREVAWFLPDDPVERRGLLPRDLVTQSEDVLVDARGVVYVSDKNHGLHVLRVPGLLG
jgi:hypothetical protein